jgi:hypothetical protein
VGAKDHPIMQFSLYKFVSTITMSLLLVGGSYVGYRWLRADIAASVYRERLQTVAQDYETLRARYNDAIRKAAVTELVVKDNKVTIEVRLPDTTSAAAGGPGGAGATGGSVLRRIETPVDPAREVFVDYVVIGGRLLIRRVFDSATPADKAFTIDPTLANVDWSDPQACHGTAVYRKLTEGRWVVSVTGNGALGLTRSQGNEPSPLVAAPDIKSYEKETTAADEKLAEVGWGDVWRRVTGE